MEDQYADGIYILVKLGKVQRAENATLGDKVGNVWPVTRNHEDAKRLINYWKLEGVSPALVGSVEGESLPAHVRLAIEDGCIAAVCVTGWNDDGSPIFGVLNLDRYEGELDD